MTHTIPKVNWVSALTAALQHATPGDVIEVDTLNKVQLAHKAIERMNLVGLRVVVVDDHIRFE